MKLYTDHISQLLTQFVQPSPYHTRPSQLQLMLLIIQNNSVIYNPYPDDVIFSSLSNHLQSSRKCFHTTSMLAELLSTYVPELQYELIQDAESEMDINCPISAQFSTPLPPSNPLPLLYSLTPLPSEGHCSGTLKTLWL